MLRPVELVGRGQCARASGRRPSSQIFSRSPCSSTLRRRGRASKSSARAASSSARRSTDGSRASSRRSQRGATRCPARPGRRHCCVGLCVARTMTFGCSSMGFRPRHSRIVGFSSPCWSASSGSKALRDQPTRARPLTRAAAARQTLPICRCRARPRRCPKLRPTRRRLLPRREQAARWSASAARAAEVRAYPSARRRYRRPKPGLQTSDTTRQPRRCAGRFAGDRPPRILGRHDPASSTRRAGAAMG